MLSGVILKLVIYLTSKHLKNDLMRTKLKYLNMEHIHI